MNGISPDEPRKHKNISFVIQGSHTIPDVPEFFVPAGHRKQGPKLVVFLAVPGRHGADI